MNFQDPPVPPWVLTLPAPHPDPSLASPNGSTKKGETDSCTMRWLCAREASVHLGHLTMVTLMDAESWGVPAGPAAPLLPTPASVLPAEGQPWPQPPPRPPPRKHLPAFRPPRRPLTNRREDDRPLHLPSVTSLPTNLLRFGVPAAAPEDCQHYRVTGTLRPRVSGGLVGIAGLGAVAGGGLHPGPAPGHLRPQQPRPLPASTCVPSGSPALPQGQAPPRTPPAAVRERGPLPFPPPSTLENWEL